MEKLKVSELEYGVNIQFGDRLPRLTDGLVSLTYEPNNKDNFEDWKATMNPNHTVIIDRTQDWYKCIRVLEIEDARDKHREGKAQFLRELNTTE